MKLKGCRRLLPQSVEHRVFASAVSAVALGFALDASGGTFVVNTTGDPGPVGTLSLRQAVALANAADGNTVQFDASLVGSTITLAGGDVPINKHISVAGPGADKLTISANGASRIFRIYSCASGGIVTVSGLTLTNGTGGAYSGGAIDLLYCDLQLTDSKVTSSQALSDKGGAIYVRGAHLKVAGSTISGNTAFSGGGIAVAGSDGYVSLTRTTISGNTASYYGGGVLQESGQMFFYASTISGNNIPVPPGAQSHQGGGGVYSSGGRFSAINSTIAYNYAYSGGGGIALGSPVSASLSYTTVAGNGTCCYETGNGITVGGGQLNVFNTIVANNFSRGGIADISGTFKFYYSVIRNPANATIVASKGSIFGVDPKLSALGYFGGATATMMPAPDSSAIDRGLACIPPGDHDQRGLPRCVSGYPDAGAVERQIPEVVIFRNGFDPGG